MRIIDWFRRFVQRQSEATHETQHDRLDAMVKAQETDKRA
jgi:hypothetical protein